MVAGGYRIADGEVAEYSAGGPERHAPERVKPQLDQGTTQHSAYAPTRSVPRQRPDVTAPSDIGNALRGLRVPGVRAGSVRRLSGTSAAAPSVARAIANFQYAVTWEHSGKLLDDGPELKNLRQRFGIEVNDHAGSSEDPDPARGTPTPRKDDLYRRGRWRLR